MNREIEFRGKVKRPDGVFVSCTDKNDGEWVFGDLEIRRKDGMVLIHLYNADGGYYRKYYVDPDTVGQFTGLVDKNGVKIFEGDIIRIYDSDYKEYSDHQVKFAHGVFGIDNWTGKLLTTLSFFMCGNDSEYSVEVIGNIYDNPELLSTK